MKTSPLSWLPLVALLSLTACKKDKDKEPSKTDVLTTGTWQESQEVLQLNAAVGTRPVAASSTSTYQFGRDGKLTVTPAGGAARTGSWAFANNETQLTITNGSASNTFELFELSKNKLSYGLRYNQAEIQRAFGSGGGPNDQLLTLVVLSAGSYSFPGGTPTTPVPQLTSVQWGITAVPR